MDKFYLGWAICATLICLLTVYLLSNKETTENNIENLKQKNKRNKNSNIDNDISARVEVEEAVKRAYKRKKRLFTKNK